VPLGVGGGVMVLLCVWLADFAELDEDVMVIVATAERVAVEMSVPVWELTRELVGVSFVMVERTVDEPDPLSDCVSCCVTV
jgi:hypothetical protein